MAIALLRAPRAEGPDLSGSGLVRVIAAHGWCIRAGLENVGAIVLKFIFL
jgi:hypothetical protein